MAENKYTAKITSEHSQRPKFMGVVFNNTQPFCSLFHFLGSYTQAFDLDAAIGAQLDHIGQWIGRSRFVDIPLTGLYFTWDDTADVGWSSGLWKGQFDPESGLISLPDESYRTLLKAKVAANSWDGSIPGAYAIWDAAFGGQSHIIIQDNQDMSMSVAIAGQPLDIVTRALLTNGYLPLKPEGVRINFYIITPVDGQLLAWDAESTALAGWDAGNWGIEITTGT
ncbi:DUF2612 domain-containing protein [Bordetella avium]|uniref:DUF2612 domain-containing protein n=1 Tax=Bordetella avium TaxID=521 RepID=UPI000E0BEC94|nr:DUF2612 domain-containing protein [Bordetella avium]UOK17565.1 hypothetical protein vBBaMIFTN9_24 [Bordetella phage vB_BaM-IFTN9]RIQ11489.1 DUF2612 domain-containing protein [Bordetella avium]RIQ17442.1 DUF2612 domain-containing protein [Bordetella avium]RIQ42353.1 DUF2612 domain-containing protein [Bordetella avium]RIQ42803.1 DUF2612 domain-containing protein [Bordetella avium]